MLRPRYVPPADIFPVDPWVFEATRFDAGLASQLVSQAETLFALCRTATWAYAACSKRVRL